MAAQRPVSPERFIADAWIAHINDDVQPGTLLQLRRREARQIVLSSVFEKKPQTLEFVIDFIVKNIKNASTEVARTGLSELAKVVGGTRWLREYVRRKSVEPADKFSDVLYVMDRLLESTADGDFSDSEIAAALRATLGNEVAAAAMLKKGKKTWQ